MKQATRAAQQRETPSVGVSWWAILATLLLATLASYWDLLRDLIAFWQQNGDYSVGMLVPFAAVYLIWSRRAALRDVDVRPAATGLALLLVAQAMRIAGLYWAYESLERLSLVMSIWAVVWACGGWALLMRLRWILLFLLIMLPLPGRVHDAIALPLQQYATALAVFGLELSGYFVGRDGNVLHLDGTTTVMVAEACSGLRMLMAFVFTAALLAFVVQRPVWMRVVLLLSSVPVALLCNGLRVFATSVAVHHLDDPILETQFHDWAGLAMMPIAIGALLGKLHLMQAVVDDSQNRTHKSQRTRRRTSEQTA